MRFQLHFPVPNFRVNTIKSINKVKNDKNLELPSIKLLSK